MFWQHYPIKSTFCRAMALYIHMKQILIIAAMVATSVWAHVPVAAPDHTISRAHLPRVPRGKLLRSNPHRFTAIRLQGTDPYDAPDDDYICSSTARRPKVAPPTDPSDDELSEYVRVRLAVARDRAMARYREIHA
jgi:hypothetical protein